VDLDDDDYVSQARISEASLEFPRLLVESTIINGRLVPGIECSSGIDCQRKCEYLSQTSRNGGLPAPVA